MRPAALILPLALAACRHAPLADRAASRGEPAAATLDDVPVCGHAVRIALNDGRGVEGELVEATPERLLVAGSGGLQSLEPASIGEVLVEVLPSRTAGVTVSTIVGGITTVSHGVFLIFTFPIWVVTGVSTGAAAATRASEEATPGDPRLASYARFPQGAPAGWPAPGQVVVPCKPAAAEGGAAPRPSPPGPVR